MSLINCPTCGKEISSEAPSCPNCGHPLKAGAVDGKPEKTGLPKVLKIALAIAAVLLLAPTLTFADCVGTAFLMKDYGVTGGAELHVTTKEGTEETLGSYDLRTKAKENQVRVDETYIGGKVEFTDEVDSIDKNVYVDNKHVDGTIQTANNISVAFSDADIDLISSLEKGDRIRVSGTITGIDLNIECYSSDNIIEAA